MYDSWYGFTTTTTNDDDSNNNTNKDNPEAGAPGDREYLRNGDGHMDEPAPRRNVETYVYI